MDQIEPMKVVQIQYATRSAGSSALRLHKAFKNNGVQSSIISLQKDEVAEDGIEYLGMKARLIAMLDTKIQNLTRKKIRKGSGLFSYPVYGSDVSKMTIIREADIIYVHWVLNGFMSLKSIEKLARLNKPLVIVMHDMWHITGGCHYSLACANYKSGCLICPAFLNPGVTNKTKKEHRLKKRLYDKYNNLYFISPSQWLMDCAKGSTISTNKKIFKSPNYLDDTIYKKIDKNIARQVLNIESNVTIICFGAMSVKDTYKGLAYLEKALELLSNRDSKTKIELLIFGKAGTDIFANRLPYKVHVLGYLKDEYSAVLAYNAADVFVAPSVADNLPTTVLESLSCGTPVAAFDTGGIREMIDHKENGYLAQYKNAEDLAEGILFCIDSKLNGYTLPSFKPVTVLSNYIEIQNKLVAQHSK